MTTSPKDLATALNTAAKEHERAAGRAHTISDEDQRNRNAAQLRFVAALTLAGHVEMGAAWLIASGRMLEAYTLTDQARDALERMADDLGPDMIGLEASALHSIERDVYPLSAALARRGVMVVAE